MATYRIIEFRCLDRSKILDRIRRTMDDRNSSMNPFKAAAIDYAMDDHGNMLIIANYPNQQVEQESLPMATEFIRDLVVDGLAEEGSFSSWTPRRVDSLVNMGGFLCSSNEDAADSSPDHLDNAVRQTASA